MKSKFFLLIFVFFLLSFAGCAPPEEVPMTEPEGTGEIEAIGALRDEYVSAYNAGSVERLVLTCTPDAVLMPPHEPAVSGHETVGDRYTEIFEKFTAELSLTSEEVQVGRDWAFDWGTYKLTMESRAEGPKQEDQGKYLVILRKEDGSWKLARQIWNSDTPVSAGQ